MAVSKESAVTKWMGILYAKKIPLIDEGSYQMQYSSSITVGGPLSVARATYKGYAVKNGATLSELEELTNSSIPHDAKFTLVGSAGSYLVKSNQHHYRHFDYFPSNGCIRDEFDRLFFKEDEVSEEEAMYSYCLSRKRGKASGDNKYGSIQPTDFERGKTHPEVGETIHIIAQNKKPPAMFVVTSLTCDVRFKCGFATLKLITKGW